MKKGLFALALGTAIIASEWRIQRCKHIATYDSCRTWYGCGQPGKCVCSRPHSARTLHILLAADSGTCAVGYILSVVKRIYISHTDVWHMRLPLRYRLARAISYSKA